MDNKNRFQEMLGDILEVARVQGNQLGMNEIKSLFGDINLNEAQYEQIFAYFAANQIKIKGYVETENEYTKAVQKENGNSDDIEDEQDDEGKGMEDKEQSTAHTHEEDSAYLKMYLEDLKAIKDGTPEEESILIDKMLKGDEFAKTRYIEANLHYVVKIASDYKNRGVTIEDLIQEGNMGLISSLESISEFVDRKQVKENAAEFIRKFMEAAITEEKESSSFENNIIKKANYIREAANVLAEDLGREANIHELAKFIKMSEEDITEILKMTVNGVKLESKHSSKESQAGGSNHLEGHNHTQRDH